MNHIPQYPCVPKTAFTSIASGTLVTTNTVTSASTLLYTVPITVKGAMWSDVILFTNGTSTASVCRFFINNGNDYNVAANNALLAQYTITAVTASSTAIAHRQQQILDVLLPSKFRVYVNVTAATGVSLFITGNFLEY